MNKYVEFRKKGIDNNGNDMYIIWNKIYDKKVGEIRKERMGTWMHWQTFQELECGFSNGCLKEITPFITTLYKKKVDNVSP